jgi:hypothetical protein
MISFRFHVVSITAIFLAIAIGVVVGSTYVDELTVDQLRSRIETVEDRADATRGENGRLEEELATTREYVDLSSEYAVTDRLTDVPVFLTAVRGVDEAAVERTLVLLRRAGGAVPGIVWLEPRWAAEGDEDAEALAAIVGGSGSSSREDLWTSAWEDIAGELTADAVSEPGTVEPGVDTDEPAGEDGPSTLSELEAAGFLTIDPLDDDAVAADDLLGRSPRVVVLTGARADDEIAALFPVAVAASVEAGLVTVTGDVYVTAPEAPGRGTEVIESLDEAVLEATVVVDDVDLEAGRVAVVLALDAAAEGEVGLHYGYGDGADGVLPAWTPP